MKFRTVFEALYLTTVIFSAITYLNHEQINLLLRFKDDNVKH